MLLLSNNIIYASLKDGPGLFDPCEKDPTDAADCLNDQQKEDLTASAQVNVAPYSVIATFCLFFVF